MPVNQLFRIKLIIFNNILRIILFKELGWSVIIL